MKKILLILLSLAMLGISGCRQGTGTKYVALRPLADSQSFVVKSFNNYQAQVMCANLAQGALINAGVSVVRMPPLKQVETRISNNDTQSRVTKKDSAADSTSAQEMRIENYSEYERTNAGYLVRTNGFVTYYDGIPYIDKINITIIKLDKSKEIIASFVTYEYSIKDDMYQHLKALGIKVRPEEKQQY